MIGWVKNWKGKRGKFSQILFNIREKGIMETQSNADAKLLSLFWGVTSIRRSNEMYWDRDYKALERYK